MIKLIKNTGWVVVLSLIIIGCGASQENDTAVLNTQDFSNRIQNVAHVLVDVRTPEEFATNHIPNAVNINVNSSEFMEKISVLEKDKEILVYCKSGARSSEAAKKLKKLGYNVSELEGGILKWQAAGLAIEADKKKSSSNFTMASYNEAINSGDVVLVDFYATWCGPCKMMAPHVETMKKQYGENLVVLKVDTDKSIEVSQHFKITGIPLVKVYKGGKEVYNKTGYHSAEQLEAVLSQHI